MSEVRPADTEIEDYLHHVRDFVAVAQGGSIAKASAAIYKAPSAIARAIGELERGLGVALFERKPRGLLLNAYGKAVLVRASRINDEIAEAVEAGVVTGGRRREAERTAVANLLRGGRNIRLLTALMELRNLSSAAARVGLTQAGASMALSRMEKAVGARLFQRMMRGMVATDLGAILVSRGKRIVAELRHMRSDIAAIAGTLRGHVAIGALPLSRTHVLPTAIAATLARHPNIRITIVESTYDVLAAGLRDGEIDFIVGALRGGDKKSELATESLFDDRLGVIGRAGHPLRGHKVALKDLLTAKWILPRPGAPGRQLIDQSFRQFKIEPPTPVVETGDLALIRGLLMKSDMLTAISPHQLQHELTSGALVELAVRLDASSRKIGITTRERAMPSPAARAVLAEIRRASRTTPRPPGRSAAR